MSSIAVEDVLEWAAKLSEKLSEWKRDALRLLACNSRLSDIDVEEIWGQAQAAHGPVTFV